jgi:outer membrane protein TolC
MGLVTITLPLTAQSFSAGDLFHASVPAATATGTPLDLSLDDAIQRSLKSNLGLLVRGTQTSAARADRLRALAAMIPTLYAGLSETSEQISLASYGFKFPGVPAVIGPFGVTDVRATGDATVFDRSQSKNLKALAEQTRAAVLSEQDGRDLVVQAVASGYFTILSGIARADSLRTQTGVAEALYQIARDRHAAGVTPAIDELRAKVEWQAQQQQLLAQENQVAKDKLVLARVIGLAAGQDFRLTDSAPFAPLEELSTADLVRKAYASRADYQSAQALLHSVELSRQALDAHIYPTVTFNGTYGDIGPTLASSHGTYSASGTVKFYLFDGGRLRAEQEANSTVLKQRRDELENLKGQIDFEVRTAMLDLKTAADQVAVARDSLDLATQALDQARDRFSAGVTGNIEVVQAQEALANATQNLISSQYAHNLGKVALARAVGMTESNLKQFMGSR